MVFLTVRGRSETLPPIVPLNIFCVVHWESLSEYSSVYWVEGLNTFRQPILPELAQWSSVPLTSFSLWIKLRQITQGEWLPFSVCLYKFTFISVTHKICYRSCSRLITFIRSENIKETFQQFLIVFNLLHLYICVIITERISTHLWVSRMLYTRTVDV